MPPQTISLLDPPSLGPPHPAYSNITTIPLTPSSKLITIAGQIATHPTTGVIPSTLSEQLDLVLAKVKVALEAVGGEVKDLTRVVYYIVGYEQESMYAVMMEKILAFLDGHRPASVLLGVQGLSRREFLCEVEGTAFVTTSEVGREEREGGGGS